MEHGTFNDVPNINMPIFHTWADKIHTCLKANNGKSVLVNCNNGRSRTGTVVALYMMKYHKLSANDAMSIVSAVFKFRGITKDSINIQTLNSHGNYGDWLCRWEKENNVQVHQPNAQDSNQLIKIIKLNTPEESLLSKFSDNSQQILKKIKLNQPEKTLIHTEYPQQFFKKSNINLTVDTLMPGQFDLNL